MQERLADLQFVSPPSDTAWTGPAPEWKHPTIRLRSGGSIDLDMPLFWDDPPWYLLPIDRASALAIAVAQCGIPVSALRSDLAATDGASPLHDPVSSSSEDDDASSGAALPRIVPYRPERYGVEHRDFDGATIIDVRLTMERDGSGRFAYSPAQLQRWEGTAKDHPVAGGSWVPSASFPPDVLSMEHLGTKLDQLRLLAPTAAVFVSIEPWRLSNELPAVIKGNPDGVILRLERVATNGLQLAAITRHARRLINKVGAADLPLWVVPGPIVPDDAAKLITLGATAVAIDTWCESLWEVALGNNQSAAARLGYTSLLATKSSFLSQVVSDQLGPKMMRVSGLLNSIQKVPAAERLTSLDASWRERLGLGLCVEPKLNS